MSDNFQNIWYDETQKVEWEWFKLDLLEDAELYLTLKGSKLWPYIAGIIPKPDTTETKIWLSGGSRCAASLPS